MKYPNQQVQFDYVLADFDSPCSIANAAIIVTCIEETSFEIAEILINPLFEKYPFLSTLINPTDCQQSTIEAYDLGSYTFLFVQAANNFGTLYFENGDFYCQDAANYDCRAAYNLNEPSAVWTCANFAGTTERENPFSTKVKDNEFKVYPNPTSGYLMLEIPTIQQLQTVQIFDLMGRTIQSISLDSSNQFSFIEIDLSAYQNGVYYLQLSGGGLQYMQKVVKQDLD